MLVKLQLWNKNSLSELSMSVVINCYITIRELTKLLVAYKENQTLSPEFISKQFNNQHLFITT